MTFAEIAKKPSNETFPDAYANIGVIALDNGLNLRKPDLEELKKQSDEEARATLDWLLEQPAHVIEDSFVTAAEVLAHPIEQEVVQLRDFNIGLVQRVCGMTRQKAVEAITDEASFVTTVINSIAESDEYRGRLVYNSLTHEGNGTSGRSVRFAAMRVEPATVPEMIAIVSHTMKESGTNQQAVQSIYIESSLRDRDPSYTVVLKQQGDEQPQLFQRSYEHGMYHEVPFSDRESEQQHFVALMGDIGVAFAGYRQEDDEPARLAALSGRIT